MAALCGWQRREVAVVGVGVVDCMQYDDSSCEGGGVALVHVSQVCCRRLPCTSVKATLAERCQSWTVPLLFMGGDTCTY